MCGKPLLPFKTLWFVHLTITLANSTESIFFSSAKFTTINTSNYNCCYRRDLIIQEEEWRDLNPSQKGNNPETQSQNHGIQKGLILRTWNIWVSKRIPNQKMPIFHFQFGWRQNVIRTAVSVLYPPFHDGKKKNHKNLLIWWTFSHHGLNFTQFSAIELN